MRLELTNTGFAIRRLSRLATRANLRDPCRLVCRNTDSMNDKCDVFLLLATLGCEPVI